MAERIGFIGLGIMGKPMAQNILKAGFPLTVWNRTEAKMKDLLAEGAQGAKSPAEVAANSDIIISIVSDVPDIKDVVLGTNGVIHAAQEGKVLIDMSTIPPSVVKELAGELASKGMEMLDAPVSGGEKGAINGALSIMLGGKEEVFQRCLPVFEAMGKNIVHVGGIGDGQGTKLCNQVIVALNLLATCEGLLLGAKAGLNLEKVFEAISGGSAQSFMLTNQAPKIMAGDFSPGFMIKHQRKDIRLIMETAAELGVALPAMGLVQQLYNTLADESNAELGNQTLVKALENLCGVQARS